MRYAIIVSLLLSGCAAGFEERRMESNMNRYGPACEKLGFATGTDPWRNCILQLSTEQIQKR